MTQDVIRLDIVTPAGSAFSEMVSYVQLPAAQGLMGILANHAALMTTIDIGAVKYVQNDTEHYLAVCGGFVEVGNNVITMLAQVAETAEDIDVPRAQAALERAEARLAEKAEGLDRDRAQKAIAKAQNRLQVAGKLKK